MGTVVLFNHPGPEHVVRRDGDRYAWNTGRSHCRKYLYRELKARGVPDRLAAAATSQTKRWWSTASHRALHIALPNSYFDQVGVPRLAS